jgi:hypothetical protein
LGILDSGPEEPKSRLRRYILTAVVLVLLLVLGLAYKFRFYPEEQAANRFFNALAAGDTARAYQLWKPLPSYTMKEFLDDWGPTGYYGPVRSYKIESAEAPQKGGSGVVVVAELSPTAPFPNDQDVQATRRLKEVRIWVQSKDKSLSFSPY